MNDTNDMLLNESKNYKNQSKNNEQCNKIFTNTYK